MVLFCIDVFDYFVLDCGETCENTFSDFKRIF